MGLTLNTSSLTVASSGGGSGVSTSDVTTLIKNNTPWQFIAKLTASASTTIEYTSLTTDFQTFRIMYEDLTFNQNSDIYLQLYLDGTLYTSNEYKTAGYASVNGSSQTHYATQTSWRPIEGYESGDGSRHVMGFTDIGCNNTSSEKQMHSRVSSASTTSPTTYNFSGHVQYQSGKLITGFKLTAGSGNWTRGSIKIYGMN